MDLYVIRNREFGYYIGEPVFSLFACERYIDAAEKDRSEWFADEMSWQEREQWNFLAGHYKLPVWHTEPFWKAHADRHRDHYAHFSIEEPGMLAYTEDDKKGRANRQTRLKPGKYLQKFFGDVLSPKQVAFCAEWFATGKKPPREFNGDLKFAMTPDEIVASYKTGPKSCMSGGQANNAVRVYGAGDLAIAYVYDHDRAKIISRCLCWPEKKVFGRIYPNAGNYSHDGFADQKEAEDARTDLLNRLKKEGYSSLAECPTGFNGAKIIAEQVGSLKDCQFRMPYIDNNMRITFVRPKGAKDNSEAYFELNTSGPHNPQNTGGLICIPEAKIVKKIADCAHCAAEIFEGHQKYTVYGSHTAKGPTDPQTWCNACVAHGEGGAFHCDYTGYTYRAPMRSVQVENSHGKQTNVCEAVVATTPTTFERCPIAKKLFFKEAMYDVVNEKGEKERWCLKAVEENTFYCSYVNAYYPTKLESTRFPGFPKTMDDDATVTLTARQRHCTDDFDMSSFEGQKEAA